MAKRVYIDRLRLLGNAGINSSTYTAIPYGDATGAAVTVNPRIICITNDTDNGIYFSDNGTVDKLYLPKATFKLFDLTANLDPNIDDQFVIAIGTIIYAKSAGALTTGAVYVEYIYG